MRKDRLFPHEDGFLEKIHSLKQRSRLFNTLSTPRFKIRVARDQSIQHENGKLLGKLTEIAEGKIVRAVHPQRMDSR